MNNVALNTRGRKGAIRTHREKLFFLMVFMSKGVEVLEVLVTRFMRTREHIVETAKSIAYLFRDALMGISVCFLNERVNEAPGAALVVDCTVCKIRRPKTPFQDAKVFFSGKHYIYALKKEVCVNVRSGTAALVSKAYPGSVHDIKILKEHAAEVNDVLGTRSLLADLGYRGAQRDVPTIVVCEQASRELRSKRVIVECFFGRLKMLWSVFSTTWRLGEDSFDVFFDTACAFTNLDILRRPLRDEDREFNEGVIRSIIMELKRKADRQRRLNTEYRERRRERLGIGQSEESE